jgi:hypothetical protein
MITRCACGAYEVPQSERNALQLGPLFLVVSSCSSCASSSCSSSDMTEHRNKVGAPGNQDTAVYGKIIVIHLFA